VGGTGYGIDYSGERLAEEILEHLKTQMSLKTTSFVSVSMGGLINRCAAAILYDQDTKNIAGLKPTSFVTFATPHLGTRGSVDWLTEHIVSRIPLITKTTNQLFYRDATVSKYSSSLSHHIFYCRCHNLAPFFSKHFVVSKNERFTQM